MGKENENENDISQDQEATQMNFNKTIDMGENDKVMEDSD